MANLLDAAMLGAIALEVRQSTPERAAEVVCTDATPGACRVLGVTHRMLVRSNILDRLVALGVDDPLVSVRLAMKGVPVDIGAVRIERTGWECAAFARLVPHDGGLLLLLSDAGTAGTRPAHDWQTGPRPETVERRLFEALTVSPDPIALFDPDDRLVFCNETWVHASGLASMEAVIGHRFDDLLQEALRSGCWKDVAPDRRSALVAWRLAEHRKASGEEFDVPGAYGQVFRVRERRTGDGGTVCSATEVTQAANQRRMLSRAIEAIDQAFALYDSDDRLMMWNARYADAIGPDSIHVGMPLEEAANQAAKRSVSMTTTDGVPFELTARLEAHRAGAPLIEFERWHSDGTVSVVRERRMPDGSMVVTGSPITELKVKEAALEEQVNELDTARAEAERHADHLAEATRQLTLEKERAEAASRTKSRFLANMSHELRTPLNAILGFSEMIKAETFGPLGSSRYRDYADDIHASGRHLLSLINDLLDMSKIEAGKYRLDKESVSIATVIDAVSRMVRGRADEASLHLAIERVDPGLRMVVDIRALKQVLINLMANAIKFTPAGGFVELGCTIEEKSVVLSVRDSGIGIDPEDIPRLLRPFEQTHNTEHRSVEGTGLGLPLSTALVELHGGSLVIDSVPGEGTCVTVRLPVA